MQGFQFPTYSLGLGPMGRDAEPGRVILSSMGCWRKRVAEMRGKEVLLTHGSRLEVAVTVSWEHTEPILGELTWGTPTARLAARRAWLAGTAKGQVLTGMRTWLSTGEEILPPSTV